MQITKDEKERQYYNKKLIKEGFQNELKPPFRIDWPARLADCIGIFIGLRTIHLTGLEERITNGVLSILVQAAVIAVCMMVMTLILSALRGLTGKKQDSAAPEQDD